MLAIEHFSFEDVCEAEASAAVAEAMIPMNAETLVESSRVMDAASCRAWLSRLDGTQAVRLPSVDRLMRNLFESPLAPEAVFDIADQAREVHVGELDGMLERIDTARFPLSEADRTTLAPVLESLRLGRDLYKHIHALIGAEGGGEDDGGGRRAQPSPRVFVPLARALDYQVRLLVAYQRNKVAIPSAEWDELCALAIRLRLDGLIDVPLSDSLKLLSKSATPRALFVYPILLWLAAPGGRSEGGFALAARLARRWCGHIGFRFESDPDTRDIRHGPTVTLTERHSVRLVTHRLRRRLEDRRRELDALGADASRLLPHGMTPNATRKLLTDLIELWCEPRLVPRVPELRLGEVSVRFGLPRREEKLPGAVQRPVEAAYTQVSRGYVYGHFEQDTQVRRPIAHRGAPDPLSDWAQSALRAQWVSMERQRAEFEIAERAGGLCLGALAMVVMPTAAPSRDASKPRTTVPNGAPPRRMFGRVVSLAQQLSDAPRRMPVQRATVALWAGEPSIAGLRVGDSGAAFEDVLVLTPEAATWAPDSLVLAAGHFVEPCNAVLRELGKDTRIRLEELLERGAGFDRVRFSRAGA